MILVTGATGHLGSATIDFLLRKLPASQIAALARDEVKAAGLKTKGVDVRIGDYTNYDSMVKAFTGIDKLLLISSSDMAGQRAAHHISAIDAAKAAGVKHIVYTSVDIRDPKNTALASVTDAHTETVAHLKEAGIPYTLLNNNLYADVLPMFLGEKVLETGVFYPAGQGKVPFAARVDMAEAAAAVLAGEGHEGKEYAIASDEAYTMNDVATALSEISGKNVAYADPSADTYRAALTSAGTPEMFVGFLGAFGEAIKRDEFDTGHTDLPTLLGRKPMTLKEYLRTVYSN